LPPVAVAITASTPPLYDDGQTQIYEVQKQVPMPFRRYTGAETPKGNVAPYSHPPFHVASESRTTVRFTLTNIDDKKHDVDLLIDPWNEFVRYVPGITMIEDEQVEPNFSGIQRSFVLQPHSRTEGIITPDDMVELAVDLTTAMILEKTPPDPMGDFGGAVLYNRAFNIQNRSNQPDLVLAPYLPKGDKSTVAAITGFDLGIRSEEQVNVAIEVVIDVEDLSPKGDRILIADSDQGKALPRPGQILTPPAAAPKN
jgi:hypothetical protein